MDVRRETIFFALHFLEDSERTHRVLSSVAQDLEDLGHLPSRSQVHPEAGHGAPRGQADYTEAVIKDDSRNDYARLMPCNPLNQQQGDFYKFVFLYSHFAHEKY